MKICFFQPIGLSIRPRGDFDPLISMEGVPGPDSGQKAGKFKKTDRTDRTDRDQIFGRGWVPGRLGLLDKFPAPIWRGAVCSRPGYLLEKGAKRKGDQKPNPPPDPSQKIQILPQLAPITTGEDHIQGKRHAALRRRTLGPRGTC